MEDERRGALDARRARGLLFGDDLTDKRGVIAGCLPAVHVEPWNLGGETGQVAIGHIACPLGPLLAVEELGEIPEVALMPRGEGGDLLGLEGMGIPRGGLEATKTTCTLPLRTSFATSRRSRRRARTHGTPSTGGRRSRPA